MDEQQTNPTVETVESPIEQPVIPTVAPGYHAVERIFAVITLIMAFVFMRWFVWSPSLGILASAILLGWVAVAVVYLMLRKRRFSLINTGLFFAVAAFACVFALFANGAVRTLSLLFYIFGLIYGVFAVGYGKNTVGEFFPADFGASIFRMPFASFPRGWQAMFTSGREKSSGKRGAGKWVILGIVLAIPLTILVMVLLMSADSAVAQLFEKFFSGIIDALDKFFRWIGGEIWRIILQLALCVPIFMYVFGALFSAGRARNADAVSDENQSKRNARGRVFPGGLIYGVVTPTLLLYIVFFAFQIEYLIGAFKGALPEGFSYASYARRGFFELFALACVNLLIIFIITRLGKNSGEKSTPMHKIYTTIVCVFTLFLIATALAKMVMYMSKFGLTFQRLFASWALILMAVLFILLIVKQYARKFRMWSVMCVFGTVMLAALCFCNVDARIAQYNINSFKSGAHEELDAAYILEDLSTDAMVYVIKQGELEFLAEKFDATYVFSDLYNRIAGANPTYKRYQLDIGTLYLIDNADKWDMYANQRTGGSSEY